MGLLWSVVTPILMLTIYTLVFSAVFKAKWAVGPGIDESKVQFAIVLFAGLIVYNLFAEIIIKAPGLITSNVNYVKKIVFPLEILPISTVLSALFNFSISAIILLLAFIMFNGYLNWTVLWIPIVFLPLIILSLGLSWFVASLGVFIRDVNQIMGILLTIVMFLSPIFYPSSAIPAKLKPFLMINPLAFIIEQSRQVVVWGLRPDLLGLVYYTGIALFIMQLGFVWFQKTRKGFADVL
jgi:lipopolysaccharide transport system permease protein